MNRKFKVLASIVLTLIMVNAAILTGCSESYDKNVMFVREGTMYINPSVPVGKAFDQFFANSKWKSFKSTDNLLIVEFNGDCNWFNAPAKMTIQFRIEDDEFYLHHLNINDVAMDEIDSMSIIEKVLSEYQATK